MLQAWSWILKSCWQILFLLSIFLKEVVCNHFQVLADTFNEQFVGVLLTNISSFHYVSAFVYRYATLMLDQTQQALYLKVICVVFLLLPEFIDWQIVPLDCSDNHRAQEHPAEALLPEIWGEGKLFHQGCTDHMTMESNHLYLNPVLNFSWGQREQLQTISLRRTTTNSPGVPSPMLEASQTLEAEP